jgi:hypothetical protein
MGPRASEGNDREPRLVAEPAKLAPWHEEKFRRPFNATLLELEGDDAGLATLNALRDRYAAP